MLVDTWIAGCKVNCRPWIDHKTMIFNVQYYRPGQSLNKPPVWDRTVYIEDNDAGRRIIREFTDSLVTYISQMPDSRFDIGEGNKLVFKFS